VGFARSSGCACGRLYVVFTTAGSTGEPKRVYFTWRELQMLTNLAAAGLRVGHPGRLWVLIALPIEHGLWIGTPTAIRIVERAGGLPIPVGTADPIKTLQWMGRFEPNVVMSSPSYMTTLTCEAERQGYRIRLDQILLSGEMLSSTHQRYFHEYWGASTSDAYGTTEIGRAQAIALPACTAFSLNDLCLVTEIVDPVTRQAADEGELVFTTLAREGMPLIRYLSGDRARWAGLAARILRPLAQPGQSHKNAPRDGLPLGRHPLQHAISRLSNSALRPARLAIAAKS
jgi:phenylacetate-CoA ligase